MRIHFKILKPLLCGSIMAKEIHSISFACFALTQHEVIISNMFSKLQSYNSPLQFLLQSYQYFSK